jgi:hypothetical protein
MLAVTDSGGKFTVHVSPGEYTAAVVQGLNCKTMTVHVTAGDATFHDLACDLT